MISSTARAIAENHRGPERSYEVAQPRLPRKRPAAATLGGIAEEHSDDRILDLCFRGPLMMAGRRRSTQSPSELSVPGSDYPPKWEMLSARL